MKATNFVGNEARKRFSSELGCCLFCSAEKYVRPRGSLNRLEFIMMRHLKTSLRHYAAPGSNSKYGLTTSYLTSFWERNWIGRNCTETSWMFSTFKLKVQPYRTLLRWLRLKIRLRLHVFVEHLAKYTLIQWANDSADWTPE